MVATHSYSHGKLDAFVGGYPELARAQDIIHQCLGVVPAFYRPPYGVSTDMLLDVVATEGMLTISWDVNPGDWNAVDGATIARRVLKRARRGSIVLLHDGTDGDLKGNRAATAAGVRIRAREHQPADALRNAAGYTSALFPRQQIPAWLRHTIGLRRREERDQDARVEEW